MPKENIDITVRAVAININKTYRTNLNAAQLYDFTRGVWRLDRDRAEKAKYAFSVYEGEILEVYEISTWSRAGRTEYKTGRTFTDEEKRTRFEFVGQVAPEMVRRTFVGKFLSDSHSQNPIKYFKC